MLSIHLEPDQLCSPSQGKTYIVRMCQRKEVLTKYIYSSIALKYSFEVAYLYFTGVFSFYVTFILKFWNCMKILFKSTIN